MNYKNCYFFYSYIKRGIGVVKPQEQKPSAYAEGLREE